MMKKTHVNNHCFLWKFLCTITILSIYETLPLYAQDHDTDSEIKCEKIDDVFASKNVSSYLVTSKVFFFNNCINSFDFCNTGLYVIAGDYLIAGYQGQSLCAAYVPKSYTLPTMFGWLDNDKGISKVNQKEYNSLLGSWTSNNAAPVNKTISFEKYNQKIMLTGDLGAAVSGRYYYLEGTVLKTAENNYISIHENKECMLDIYLKNNKLELNDHGTCDSLEPLYSFRDIYEKNK